MIWGETQSVPWFRQGQRCRRKEYGSQRSNTDESFKPGQANYFQVSCPKNISLIVCHQKNPDTFIHIQQNSIHPKFNIKERKEEKVGIQISLFQQQALGGG